MYVSDNQTLKSAARLGVNMEGYSLWTSGYERLKDFEGKIVGPENSEFKLDPDMYTIKFGGEMVMKNGSEYGTI